jgi:GTP pyrophosphokinase
MRFLFQVSTVESIDRIIAKLESIDGVIEARRMMPGDTVSKK